MIEYAGARTANRTRRTHRAEEAVSLVRRLDWVLLGSVLGLVAFGLWAIAGVTRLDVAGDEDYYVIRQAIFAAVGFVGLLAAAAIEPDAFRRAQRPLYGVLLGSLVLVLVAGAVVRGSQRWIDLGFFQFQPSEFGKPILVLFLAAFLADRGKQLGEARTVAAAVGLAAAPAVLVFVQPDFGTALVYLAALAGVLFVAGTRWLHLGALASLAALVAVSLVWLLPAAGVDVLKDYQYDRLTALFDSESASPATTYNAEQSITAVGAGGLDGRGVRGATQTNYDYLPEHATDFAFASLAEQRGFVGAATLLGLYLLLLWRGLRIVSLAGDAFSAMVAGGIVVALLFQIFVNVGMAMGIAPVTGVPLPFVSVGGSSMVANLLGMGVLLAIYARAPRRGR
jgi:rod shape determining protein RodA